MIRNFIRKEAKLAGKTTKKSTFNTIKAKESNEETLRKQLEEMKRQLDEANREKEEERMAKEEALSTA